MSSAPHKADGLSQCAIHGIAAHPANIHRKPLVSLATINVRRIAVAAVGIALEYLDAIYAHLVNKLDRGNNLINLVKAWRELIVSCGAL